MALQMPWLLSGPSSRGQKSSCSNCGSPGVPGSATNQNASAPPGASHGLLFSSRTERSLRFHAHMSKGPGWKGCWNSDRLYSMIDCKCDSPSHSSGNLQVFHQLSTGHLKFAHQINSPCTVAPRMNLGSMLQRCQREESPH